MSEIKKFNEPKKFKVTDQLLARFTVCVEPDVFNRLTTMAHRRNMPRSELVREIIAGYIRDHQSSGRSRQERVNA